MADDRPRGGPPSPISLQQGCEMTLTTPEHADESSAARLNGTPGQPVLVCRDLRKRYGERTAVDGVGFEIAAGETYGLLGPNGAGKTTSISMICGLLRRDGGEVVVAGRPVDIGATDAKAAIGYVPQDLAIYPDLTARENLRFFGRLQRLRGKELDRRVDEVLAVIDLADRAGDRTDGFSGGMKRRLNIGIGLLHHPRLLVLDEPTVGVDPQSRNAILSSVAELEKEGMAILYTTHYMEEAERLCDRIGIIDEGKIRAEGTRRELIAWSARRTGSSWRPAGRPGRQRPRCRRSTASKRRRRPTGGSSWWSARPGTCFPASSRPRPRPGP
jgi:ABC-2 type transport system ATP-binding protein